MRKISIEPQDKIAIHTKKFGGWPRYLLIVGAQPLGPRGGSCGIVVNGTCVCHATSTTVKRFENAKSKIIKAIELANSTDLTVEITI